MENNGQKVPHLLFDLHKRLDLAKLFGDDDLYLALAPNEDNRSRPVTKDQQKTESEVDTVTSKMDLPKDSVQKNKIVAPSPRRITTKYDDLSSVPTFVYDINTKPVLPQPSQTFVMTPFEFDMLIEHPLYIECEQFNHKDYPLPQIHLVPVNLIHSYGRKLKSKIIQTTECKSLKLNFKYSTYNQNAVDIRLTQIYNANKSTETTITRDINIQPKSYHKNPRYPNYQKRNDQDNTRPDFQIQNINLNGSLLYTDNQSQNNTIRPSNYQFVPQHYQLQNNIPSPFNSISQNIHYNNPFIPQHNQPNQSNQYNNQLISQNNQHVSIPYNTPQTNYNQYPPQNNQHVPQRSQLWNTIPNRQKHPFWNPFSSNQPWNTIYPQATQFHSTPQNNQYQQPNLPTTQFLTTYPKPEYTQYQNRDSSPRDNVFHPMVPPITQMIYPNARNPYINNATKQNPTNQNATNQNPINQNSTQNPANYFEYINQNRDAMYYHYREAFPGYYNGRINPNRVPATIEGNGTVIEETRQ